MSMLATPVLSVAFQLIFCAVPIGHTSPPFGLVTVTDGAWLSIGTVAGGPASAGRSAFEQSRSLIAVIVIVPGPLGLELATPIENSVPLVAVGPQFDSNASSTG